MARPVIRLDVGNRDLAKLGLVIGSKLLGACGRASQRPREQLKQGIGRDRLGARKQRTNATRSRARSPRRD